ncbi:MAG: biotin transporter BioY [Casimicrobiaceae bacterium]
MKPQTSSSLALPVAPKLFGTSRDSSIVLVIVAIALLWASAKIQIPLWPVPITMQTYVVLVIALSYGMRLGSAAVGGYIALGLLGVPVFAGTPEKGIGVAYLAGPTGGYIIGFALATIACAWLAARGWARGFLACMSAALMGHVLILGCGVAWLAVTLGWERAIAAGLAPFLWGTAIKTVLVAVTLPAGSKWAELRR